MALAGIADNKNNQLGILLKKYYKIEPITDGQIRQLAIGILLLLTGHRCQQLRRSIFVGKKHYRWAFIGYINYRQTLRPRFSFVSDKTASSLMHIDDLTNEWIIVSNIIDGPPMLRYTIGNTY